MPRLSFVFLMYGLVLSGCAQQQVVAAPDNPAPSPLEVKKEEAQAAPPESQEEASYPAIALTDDLLFQFLVADIAGQRGMLGLAKEGYLDHARKTRDPRIVRRAAEIALYSRDQEAALELSRLWLELEPGSSRAQQTLAVMLIAQGQIKEAAPYLEKMLSGENVQGGFMQLPIGLIQATETLKLILGKGSPLLNRLVLFDALQMQFRELNLRRDPQCPRLQRSPRDYQPH